MTQSSLSLEHLTREPSVASDGAPPLLLLLHGLGSNERDLFALAPYVDGRLFVVSARAPLSLDYDAYAWFHVQFTPEGPSIIPDEAEASRRLLLGFIDEVISNYQLDPARVYLGGFSQGAIMSLFLLLTQPDRIAGVVAMSGRLLPDAYLRRAASPHLDGKPVLVIHGTEDQVLPIEYGRDARDRLSTLPLDLAYREYQMGHQVTPESLQETTCWLTERLDRSERETRTGYAG